MKSRKRCAAVALWLTLPIAVSTQMATAFTSEAVLSRCGVVTAALNMPGLLAAYLLGWRTGVSALTLMGAGDVVFYVPVLYGVLRWSGERRRVRTRKRMAKDETVADGGRGPGLREGTAHAQRMMQGE